MLGLEPFGLAVLTKAVDFLFEEASNTLKERREIRKVRNDNLKDQQEKTEKALATKKEEVLTWQPKKLVLDDTSKEIEHCISQIHQYRQNQRYLETQIALYGGAAFAPIALQNQMQITEIELVNWYNKLKQIVEDTYGQKIVIPGLDA